MKNNVDVIRDNLFHIHSLANLLTGKYQELLDSKTNDSTHISNPILSISEMITEKTESCLTTVEDIENKLNESKLQ
jgi:hypothetical protein